MRSFFRLFPLIPEVEVWGRQDHQPRGFRFQWLILTVLTLRTPGIELHLVADEDGIVVRLTLLYIMVRLYVLPISTGLSLWLWRHFYRIGKDESPN